MAIDRTAYNALVDDDGSNTVGTLWTKNIVKTVLLDPIDLSITAAWVVPTFNAAHYGGSGSMTWTVDAGDVTAIAWRLQGKTMTVVFSLDTTSIGGTVSNALLIKNGAWGGYTAARQAVNAVGFLGVALGTNPGWVIVRPGGSNIEIQRNDWGAYTACTNTAYVYGQITFEVN